MKKSSPLVPYAQNEQADFTLLLLSTMYYSITQLAHVALALDAIMHEVFHLNDRFIPTFVIKLNLLIRVKKRLVLRIFVNSIWKLILYRFN